MKMYVKPSFELEEVLSEDIITESPFKGVVGRSKNETIEGVPGVSADVNDLL